MHDANPTPESHPTPQPESEPTPASPPVGAGPAPRCLVIDDEARLRQVLCRLMDSEGYACLEAGSGAEALEVLERTAVPLVLTDLRMPQMDGIELLRELNRRGEAARVVLLTASLDDARLLEAFRLGAKGLVLKESAPRLLVQSVRQVSSGQESWNGTAIAGALRILLQRHQAIENAAATLTPRELEITKMVAQGLRNKDIATRLTITEGTVKFHLHSIYEKLQIDGRFALITWARDHGVA